MTLAIAYHILNGDCLLKQFPEEIPGERVVMCECLVDGPVLPDFGDPFYEIRSAFIQLTYLAGDQEYHKKSVPEINKISRIPEGASVYLWFEDDLFCLVNLISIIHNIKDSKQQLFFVRASSLEYGFGGMSNEELIKAYNDSRHLTSAEIQAYSKLWEAYCKSDRQKIINYSKLLIANGLVLKAAIDCHLNRISDTAKQDHPKYILSQLMNELGTMDFNYLFSLFHKRYPIYGFGDLQFKRIYNAVILENPTVIE